MVSSFRLCDQQYSPPFDKEGKDRSEARSGVVYSAKTLPSASWRTPHLNKSVGQASLQKGRSFVNPPAGGQGFNQPVGGQAFPIDTPLLGAG
jgi:hypothetical protein